MADAYRPKASTSSSTTAIYGKTSRSKNQNPPQSSVLPRIDRRGDVPQKSAASSAKNGNLSILLPPRRPSSKGTLNSGDNSPTFHGDEFDGPSAKAAWCTPREAAPELPTGSHVASFFAGPEASSNHDEHSVVMPTPLRLQSVEDSINANEERYRVDMEQLASNNDKFFEISMSAHQHLEHVNNQLPSIAEVFDQTASALQTLSSDIDMLHQQHESARREMENQFEVAMNNTTDELVSLSEAHAAEKAELIQRYEQESQEAASGFRDKAAELEDKYNHMKKHYLDKLQDLRQTSKSQFQSLDESNRTERENQERLARAQTETLQVQSKKELDDLRSSAASAYQELQTRSQTEYAALERSTTEELAVVKKTLTSEITTLKQTSAANLAALGDRSARELYKLREQSDEALRQLKQFYLKERTQLLEKASEEIARLRMLEIDHSTHIENRRVHETKALRDELDATRTNYSTRIQELHRRYASELEVLKARTESDKALLLQTHASESEDLRVAAAQELAQTISFYEYKLRSMSKEHEAQVASNKQEAEEARDALIAKYEKDLTTLQSDRAREKDALILHYETELEAVKQSSREEFDDNAKLHESQVAQLRETHSSRVLALEMAMREQNKQAEDTIREKDGELDSRQTCIDALEASEISFKALHEQHVERSLELLEQKNMAICELESEVWRLDQLTVAKDSMLDDTNRALKAAEEDLQVKANTILELTFVIKSRDDEIEKLRNALLDTVQTVNTKTEILELTTETLSSKAKELEATKNALRLESGRLSMVEESMHQKDGMLENTELKMESMRLNMENMRLEMKRMQMDMKLQLEHTEGEIELKNGEIRRLHGTQSELKQKNEFSQQTIERLEESLAFAQRQGEEAQRRIELLRLEATQTAEEMKKVCDELLGKEQELVVMTREKQTISTEKQRVQIQFNNLTHSCHTLHEKVELHAMQAEEIQCQYQKLLENTSAQKEERLRSEKHLHLLELSAANDVIRHLEGVEERLNETSTRIETVLNEKQHLETDVQVLNETLRKYEDTDRLLCAANEDNQLKSKLIEDKVQELAQLTSQLHESEEMARYKLDLSRMELEDAMSNAFRLLCSKNELIRLNENLESSLSHLRMEKDQLALLLGREKMKVVNEAESLQEKVAGLRKDGARAASELGDLQHALKEKTRELAYLQENLGEQTSDTRKIKTSFATLTNAHTELQTQFDSLSQQRQRENREHLSTVQSLQELLESKTKECESLHQSLDIQRQEIDLLMIQHDSHVMKLADGHRSEAVQLIESHRAQLAQLTEYNANHVAKLTMSNKSLVAQLKDDNVNQTSQLILDNMLQVTELKEDHLSEMSQLTGEHEAQVAQLSAQIAQLTEEHLTEVDRLSSKLTHITEEHRSEIARLSEEHLSEIARHSEDHDAEITQLKESHRGELGRVSDDLHYQVSELTVDRLSQITEQTEDHRAEVACLTEEHCRFITHLTDEHHSEALRLREQHKSELARQGEEHGNEIFRLAAEQRSEIHRLDNEHQNEVARLTEEQQNQVTRLGEIHCSELEALKRTHQAEIDRLADDHSLQVSALTVDRILLSTEQTEEHHSEIARIEGGRKTEVAELTEAHEGQMSRLTEEHLRHFSTLSQEHINHIAKLLDDHQSEILRLKQNRLDEVTQLKEDHRCEIARLTVEHLAQMTELSEGFRVEMARFEHDRYSEVLQLKEDHRGEVDQLLGAHRNYVNQLRTEHYDGFGLLQEEYEDRRKEIEATFTDKCNQERTATRRIELENHQLCVQQQVKSRAINQQQFLLRRAADEQIRVVCAYSLEMMTIRVEHQHEIESMEERGAATKTSYVKQLTASQSQISQLEAEVMQTFASMKRMEVEYAQALENMKKMEADQDQVVKDMKQQNELEKEAARQLAEERHEQAIADHKKMVQELTETFTQNAELMRLRLTEEHLTKVNELLDKARVEEERHASVLTTAREELSDKSSTLKSVEDVVVALKVEMKELQTAVQDTKQEVLEREADVAAKNATIDNVRKELNLLMETSKSTRSSEQFVALIRQQLETHVMEVYHVDLNDLQGFVLEEESDLLGCLKGFFAMRCYRGVAPAEVEGSPASSKAVTGVEEVRELLREHDRVVEALGLHELRSYTDSRTSPSKRISALIAELERLKLHVGQVFVSPDAETSKKENIGTETLVQLLDGLSDLFETLAIPRELEFALIRSRQLLGMFMEHERLLLTAKTTCLKEDIQSLDDVGNLFLAIDQVLTRARQVTRSDSFVRLEHLNILFDEWEALYKELDSNTSNEVDQECSLDAIQPELSSGNYLRSAEILVSRQEAADFVQRCKDALQFAPDEVFYPDEIVDAIEQLMKIVYHFELLQPKLGSPRRQSTATDPPPTIEDKVRAVLAFVDELQLMADFAQNILSDENKNDSESASNESSRPSLEALRALTRTPSPASTLEELQIEVELDAMQTFDPNICEFSNEEGDKQQRDFFSSTVENSLSRSPSPFLADSLMDISLVMSDHHRLLSQTAHWVAKSMPGSTHSRPFSVGTEISCLVREHCSLLSLSRRLFKMKDPRQELVLLLEGVALLERMTTRLSLFHMSFSRHADEMSCRSFPDSYCGRSNTSESATSLGKSDCSFESKSRPVLASIGEMARYLQDYDYFLQHVQVKVGDGDNENNSRAGINIETLVREINEQVTLVEQSKEMLRLQNVVDELPQFLIGAQEVLRQAKHLRESSVCLEKFFGKTEVEPQDANVVSRTGLELALSEMDSVVEDLRSYVGMLAWMKQEFPESESVSSVAGFKDRLSEVLAKVDSLTRDNTSLIQDKERLERDVDQMKQVKDHLVEEASKGDQLLMQLAVLQPEPSQSSIHPSITRFELLETLIQQQKGACEEAEQRRTDIETEISFLSQHDLLSETDATDQNAPLSVSTRVNIYNRLLECVECLRLEKSEMENSLVAEKNKMETLLKAEKDEMMAFILEEKNALESSLKQVKSTVEILLKEEKSTLELTLNAEIQRLTGNLESVEGELAQVRQEMKNALDEERTFLSSKEIFSSLLNVRDADGSFPRIQVYQQLHDELSQFIREKREVESCAAREYEFLKAGHLLPQNLENAEDGTIPMNSALSSIRLGVFQRLVDSQKHLQQYEDDTAQEYAFLQDNNLPFDPNAPNKSRLAVYKALLAGQNALIEKKMEREVALESEKAFLASHGVPTFDNPMEVYEQFVQARKQLATLASELEEELRFLSDNKLCSDDELSGYVASLATPFSSSFRLSVYRRFLQTEAQAREVHKQLQENMDQQLSRQIASDGRVIASLSAKVERLETSLMAWQETAYASQREWDRMLLEEEDKRRSLTRQHDEIVYRTAESHARALEEISKTRDSAVALASATHAEALEEATKEHENRLASELQKQAQQLELAAFVHAENELLKNSSDASASYTSTPISAAQAKAQLLEKFAKRDTTAISMIYKAIRLTTDILSAVPTVSAATISSSTSRNVSGATSEVSTDVTQTVLACVKELKALKEFLVQSLEQVARDDDQVPPSFAKAPYAKWMADAVTRATADTECAIDLALCSHREFMSFAEVQLLTRQEEVDKALARVLEKMKTAACSGGFSADQEKLLALELEVTREREARENVSCKFRLNEEYYRRLLDERKEMEIAQAASVEGLREESKALRLKLEKLEQQLQQQAVLPQFRPPSSNTYTSSPRASVMSPQTPRVLKSAVVSNVPMPMRPERPRGGGSAHKDRYVSDLERETGQRRTNTTARRLNEWKTREKMTTENPGSQLEQDFRAIQAAVASHHTPAMEAVIPTVLAAPATAPGSSLQNQELWYQGVRSIHYVSFFISIFHVPRQQLFRVEVFNSDTEQQQQTVYVTWTEMQAFLQESRKAVRLGITLPADPDLAVTISQRTRAEIMDVLFERVRVYGEGPENILLGFE